MMEEDNFFKFQPRIQRLGQPKPTKAGSGLEENGQKFEKEIKTRTFLSILSTMKLYVYCIRSLNSCREFSEPQLE